MKNNQVFVLTHTESNELIGISKTWEGAVKMLGQVSKKRNMLPVFFGISKVSLDRTAA